ncbi:hypothetical protein [Pararhizobium sp. O133]|uniref:hypothetical protein n=1 Tax=Pararhizobium sp. O133 TaxID=3449278 RepID=UPI003F684929
MAASFQVIALSSLDPDGSDRRDEPQLPYPEALATAQSLKFQGKAFRVFAEDHPSDDEMQAFRELGALT